MTTQPCANIFDIPYYQDSCHYFERVRHLPYPVFLDSNAQSSNGRFDIVSADPASIISSEQGLDNEDLFNQIDNEISIHTTYGTKHTSAPFVSGAIGVFSYDLGLQLNGKETEINSDWPLLVVGIYQWAIVQDHQQQKSWLLIDPKLDKQSEDTSAELLATISKSKKTNDEGFQLNSDWQFNATAEEYKSKFHRAMDYIKQGDCYQVNFAQQMSASYSGDSWSAYKTLRKIAPTPYAGYFETSNAQLISLSPERFIQVQDKQVQTQPIKGTRKRGSSSQEDVKLMAELSGSEKDRSENLMIVDLMRNDLGKCCEKGSIKVPTLFQIETHPNVHHLVSTVTGELPTASVSASLDLLKESLPGGSVTGAPKKRAMEIIDELENFERSIYCGSMAYIDNSGNMDSNILIRSLLLSKRQDDTQGQVKCWGGGGIVADSEAELEYEESLQKVRNILEGLKKTRQP